MQAVPSSWMRTFIYSWHMNEFGTVSRRLKLTPVKSPWVTPLAWTMKEELWHQARGIEANSNTYDIANQLQYLWADFAISCSRSILQANTYDPESSDDSKIPILFLQINIHISIPCPWANYGNKWWAKISGVTMHRQNISMVESCACFQFTEYPLKIIRSGIANQCTEPSRYSLSTFSSLFHQPHQKYTPVTISPQPAMLSNSHKWIERTLQTNIDRSLISLKDTFPYLTEPATGIGKFSGLPNVFCEVRQHCFRGNQ
jgi:hypothetical protein